MNKQARKTYNELEDADTNPAKPAKKTFEQAMEYHKAMDNRWFIWDGRRVTVPQDEPAPDAHLEMMYEMRFEMDSD